MRVKVLCDIGRLGVSYHERKLFNAVNYSLKLFFRELYRLLSNQSSQELLIFNRNLIILVTEVKHRMVFIYSRNMLQVRLRIDHFWDQLVLQF